MLLDSNRPWKADFHFRLQLHPGVETYGETLGLQQGQGEFA